jgi:Amt family ammonium transporter
MESAALFTANNVWMMICTALVFFMHLGFSFLEIGLTRQKNTINILFKNFFVITIGLLIYCLGGFNLMYPGFEEGSAGFFKFAGFGIAPPEGGMTAAYADGGYTWWTDFLFQGMFAATAATIVSGAVAERIKLSSFMLFTLLYVGITYPIVGSWKWGGGFLDGLGFYDFAGSTLVHSVGGWAAVIAVYLLGARIGKFDSDGKPKAIMGHNLPLAAAGVLILWLGWFGFNGGSQLALGTFDDAVAISSIFINTNLAACGGVMAAGILTRLMYGKTDVIQMLNGAIGGLVAITAEPLAPSPFAAILIGAVGGLIVVFGTKLLFNFKLDDVVGAIPAHLFAGIWGTLAVPLTNADASFSAQLIGVLSINIFVFAVSYIVWSIMKGTFGIRLSKEAETKGTDVTETGVIAYAIRD